MKTVTVEQFRNFGPCWLETVKGSGKFARIAAIRNEWTALDVLNLPDVSAQDAASRAAMAAAREHEVEMLRELLTEGGKQ